MTFLNAILLAGVAAFLIPLLIHLFNKRKVKTVRWGAMHLLHEVLRQKKRRLHIEQWLLLLTRILIPIILALCLARPVLSALRQIPGFGKTSAVVLLDDSFSMRAPGPGGTPFDRARSDVQRALDNLPRGSDAQVILSGGAPRRMLDDATTSLDLIPPKLADVPSLSGPVNPNDIFQAAGAALNKAPNAAREVIVMSDFQESDWKSFGEGSSLPGLEALMKQEPQPQVTFLRIAGDLDENLSIAAAEISALVAAEGQPVGLRVRVKNHGKRPWQDVAVHLEADGARVRTARVSVPPDGEASLSFTHAFDTIGDHSLAARIEGDSFPEDNAFHSVVQVRNQLNVLLVDGDPGSQPLTGSVDFLELALMPHQSASASLKDLIKTTKVDAGRMRAEDLRGKEVVVLANVYRLNRLNDIDRFVKEGGGLLVFAGPRCDLDWINRDFYRKGEGLYPCPVKGYGRVETNENPARILLQRFTHPALTYFNDPRAGRFQDAEFRHWMHLTPEADKARVLLTLDRGVPLFVEKTVGRGHVIAAATTADPQWSNLPLQPLYVPLTQRLVTYLATQGAGTSSSWVGAPLRINLKAEDEKKTFVLTDPTGQSTDHQPTRVADSVFIETPPTQHPGIHELTVKNAGRVPPRLFAVNMNSAEAALGSLESDKVRTLAERLGAGYAESFDSYQKLDRERRHGSEIWQPFLLALLGMLFFEVALQQRIARGR